jgi:Peptidase family S41/N-terminal domain of Peptidase_S41 in eukaryotic IRBP
MVGRTIEHRVAEHFPDTAVRRVEVLRPEDVPGRLLVRVVIAGDGSAAALTAWTEANQAAMAELRQDLSRRLPSARVLEFAFDGAGAPAVTLVDDGSLAAEQPSGREIVTKALTLLRENYVFPEVAEQAAVAVETRLEAGGYDNLDEIALAELLSADLEEVCHDKHLQVRLVGGPGLGGPRGDQDVPADYETRQLATRQSGRIDNFGIRKVERLDGNVGYLDLRRVPLPESAGPAIAAAMELVAGTYALIIDLRRNGGGHPDGVTFWCSYLVDEKTHLSDIFAAATGNTTQFWSLSYVPGTRYIDRPVYVLTSSRTFSGGEEFAYNLQVLGRAEIIGETTGGGAHPTRGFQISAAVRIGIPNARSINPVTGTNWEGTGVVPDTAVAAGDAYDTAYAKALRHVLAMPDVPPPIADEARDQLTALTQR